VSAAQRALWVAAAHGSLGADGAHAVERWVGSQASAKATSMPSTRTQNWESAATAAAPRTLTPLAGVPRDEVQRLSSRVSQIDTLVALADRAAAVNSMHGAAPTDQAWRGALQAALVELVDEGSEVERPLLRRAEELRRTVAPDLNVASIVTADRGALVDPRSSTGTIDTLIRDDALGPVESPLCGLAWRAGAPLIAAVVGALTSANHQPLAEPAATMRIGQQSVTIDGAEITPDITALIEEEALTRFPPPSGLLKGLRDDENEAPRQAERARLTKKFEQQRAEIAQLRALVADLGKAADDAVARLQAAGIKPQ
jgi:hypothetical protein